METAQTKVCRMCNRELPASEFYTSKTTADGLEARCKQCKKASERIRYAEKKKKQDTQTAVILASDQRFRKPINELKILILSRQDDSVAVTVTAARFSIESLGQ